MNELPKKFDLTNENFGYLTVVERIPTPKHLKQSDQSHWNCICICGEVISVSRESLTRGRKISCGCIKKPRKKYERAKPTVDESLKRLRRLWHGIKIRCFDENYIEYHNYGAKGIVICDRWLVFENFKEDMYESYLEFEKINGEKSATIDRIDSTLNYEPDNCRWATQLEQARNRSNNISVEIEGVIYRTISEAAESYQISYQTVMQRFNRGLRGLDLVYKGNLLKPNEIRGTNGEITYIDSTIN